MEADGAVTMLGRGSVSINTGGEKVYAEEVEAVLHAHPAIADALVVPVPDEKYGQRVAAVARVAVNLRGVDHHSVARGDTLCTPDVWRDTHEIDVALR